jgi:hypothetical protein
MMTSKGFGLLGFVLLLVSRCAAADISSCAGNFVGKKASIIQANTSQYSAIARLGMTAFERGKYDLAFSELSRHPG